VGLGLVGARVIAFVATEPVTAGGEALGPLDELHAVSSAMRTTLSSFVARVACSGILGLMIRVREWMSAIETDGLPQALELL
jgi:hypothetical protein